MALFDVMVGVLANQALNYFVSGPRRIASAMPTQTSFHTDFPTSDGSDGGGRSDPQFVKLCTILGRSTCDGRALCTKHCGSKSRRADCRAAREIQSWKRDELLANLRLGRARCPINTSRDVFSDRSSAAPVRSTSTAPTSRAASFGLRLRSILLSQLASPGRSRLGEHTTHPRAGWASRGVHIIHLPS